MWNNRWKGLKVDCIDGNYYVRLRDLEQLEETIWNDINKRFDELNAEYSKDMARIDELERIKKYLNNLNRS
jgi:hypothetical protein